MTKWPLKPVPDKNKIENDVASTEDKEKKQIVLKLEDELGETFVRNVNTSPDSDEEEWDGLHFFEDPDNPKRERSIEARIFN